MPHIYYIICIMIVFIMILLIYVNITNQPELFANTHNNKGLIDDNTEPTYTPGIIKPPDDQDGNIYKGLKKYENTLIDNEVDKGGIYKCLENCYGNCVEFGYTGTSYCFPGYIR